MECSITSLAYKVPYYFELGVELYCHQRRKRQPWIYGYADADLIEEFDNGHMFQQDNLFWIVELLVEGHAPFIYRNDALVWVYEAFQPFRANC